MEMDIDTPSKQHRLVHLDLKGAPPKISYYEQLFPCLTRWGATGLLIEYEDMFPYSGDLKDIAANNAYSVEEVSHLLQLAADSNLEVIPLVQTFGHFEFVLKHDKFCQYREVETYPMTLCPLRAGSQQLIQSMVDQVVKLHPNIQYFHIGADEVFHIGVCPQCREYSESHSRSREQLFFEHVARVVQYVTGKHDKTCIMWDDMFRSADVTVIKNSGVCDIVEPMVWFYQKNFDHLPPGMWDRYSECFPNIWIASAFKGATGPLAFVTDTSYHLENHRGWIHQIKQHGQRFRCYRGIALTGWQRYDHYSVLCELLPVGVPCLVICLHLLVKGSFTEDVHKKSSADLGFEGLMPLNPYKHIGEIPQCTFPGSRVYQAMQAVLHLKTSFKTFMKNERMNGWMSVYHVKHNYTNPAHVKYFLPEAEGLLNCYEMEKCNLEASLGEIFYPDCVEEWICVNITPKIDQLTKIVDDAKVQLHIGARPKDSV